MALRRVLQRSPNNVALRIAISGLAVQQKNFDDARKVLDDGLRLAAGDYRLLMARINVENAADGADAAIKEAKTLAADPANHQVAPLLVGDTLMSLRKFDDAAAAYGTAFQQSPSTALAVRLSQAQAADNQADAAGATLRNWLKAHPDDVPAMLSLGTLDIALHFVSDGAWFTAPDTTVRLGATGVICGSIWADTVHGTIGDHIAIPIHLDASPLSPADVARLMNESNARSISLTLSGDPKLIRFDAGAPAGGMLAALPTPPLVDAAGARAHIASDDANGDLSPSDLVAVLKTDLLLGDKERSPIALSVESFADGNADLSVGDGMVLAEYCAIDRRYVRVSGPLLAPEMTPMLKQGGVIMHLPEASRATVTLYDPLGRAVAVLHDGQTGTGTYRLRLPEEIPAGIYTARLSTDHGAATARVIIIE